MNKINVLINFLNKFNFKKELNYLKKIAIDIEDEELLEVLNDSKQRRLQNNFFNYKNLFKDNLEYTIISGNNFNNYGLEVRLDDASEFEIESISHSYNEVKNGYHNSLDIIERPEEIEIGGRKIVIFGPKKDLTSLANAIYEEVVGSADLSKCDDKLFEESKSFVPFNFYPFGNSLSIKSLFERIRLTPITADSSGEKNYTLKSLCKDLDDDQLSLKIKHIASELNKFEEHITNIYNYNKQLESKLLDYESKFAKKYSVVISYDAQDVATASYTKKCGQGTDWSSCRDIADGSREIFKDVEEGGLVAYLTNKNSPYPVSAPLARIRIRHFSTPEKDPNDFILKSEEKVYSRDSNSFDEKLLKSAAIDTFLKVVKNWVEQANSKVKNNNFVYNLSGDPATDTLANVTLNEKMMDVSEDSIGSAIDRINDLEGEDKDKLTDMLYGKFLSLFYKDKLSESRIEDIMFDIESPKEINSEKISDSIVYSIYISVMQSPAGRNIANKSRNNTMTLLDVQKFAKRITKIFPIFYTKLFDYDRGSGLIENMIIYLESIIKEVFKSFDGFTFGQKIKSLERSAVGDIIDNAVINFNAKDLLDIDNDMTAKDIAGRVSDLHSFNVYYGDVIPDKDMYKFYSKLFNLPDSYYQNIFGSLSSFAVNRTSGLIDSIPKIKEFVSQEAKKLNQSDTEYIEYVIYDSELLNKFVNAIKKYVPSDNADYRFIKFVSKKYLNDLGVVDAETEEEVVRHISKKAHMSEEDVIEKYNILKISDMKRSAPKWFLSEFADKKFFFKKKVKYGGTIRMWYLRGVRLFSKEDAIIAAKFLGLPEENIKKDFFNRGRWSVFSKR